MHHCVHLSYSRPPKEFPFYKCYSGSLRPSRGLFNYWCDQKSWYGISKSIFADLSTNSLNNTFWILTYHERKISDELYAQDHNRLFRNSTLCLVFGDVKFREYDETDPDDLDRTSLAPSVGYMGLWWWTDLQLIRKIIRFSFLYISIDCKISAIYCDLSIRTSKTITIQWFHI